MKEKLRKRIALIERKMERRQERSSLVPAPPVVLQFVTVDGAASNESGEGQQNVKCWFDGRGLVGL
jgi:hypothetical protein